AEWQDATRQRAVPVKIYYPKIAAGPCPVIVFSHGLGSSRDEYGYLGKHWASYGYLVVHVTHIGSDTSVWKNQQKPMAAMRTAALDPKNTLNRRGDIAFVLDELTRRNKDDATLKGRMDLTRIGIAGHSFGSFTTLIAAGMAVPILPGGAITLSEPRMKAGIAISSPVIGTPEQYPMIYSDIKTPLLHITGTKDLIDDTADKRRVPYDNIKNADQYLVTFKGADHLVFSGKRLTGKAQPGDATVMKDTLICTTAFWDAYLRDDSGAKKWLTDGEFPRVLGKDGVWEQRVR
ncbi:MAG: acetylhydrolase, partial [bacterium]